MIARNVVVYEKRTKVRSFLSNLTDEELVQGFIDGYENFFDELDGRYRNLFYRMARKYCISFGADPEDLVQDAFFKIVRNIKSFDPNKGRFYTWACLVLMNLIRNQARGAKRKNAELILFNEKDSLVNSQQRYSSLDQEDFLLLLERTILQLPPHFQTIFRLCCMEGRSYDEISQQTGVVLGTVKSRMHRAKRNVRKILQETPSTNKR